MIGDEVKRAVEDLCVEVETRALAYHLPEDAAVVAWDTETTGLQGVVVQLGVVVLDAHGREVGVDSRLFAPLPTFPMEPGAFAVHKISPKRQADEGEPVSKCLQAFGELAQSASFRGVPLVAHNAAFDKRMLRNTATAAGCAFPEITTLCTMNLGRTVYTDANGKKKRPKNRDLYNLLIGGAPEDAQLHDAVEDARLTAHSFLAGRRNGYW